MRVLVWAFWLVLFVLFFGFALNNTAHAELYFFSGWSWQAPLIALLLAFFLGGVVSGMAAMLPTWLRLRLEIRRLKKSLLRDPPSADAGAGSVAQVKAIQTVAQGARTTS
jgi:uncharacterized integral membrane protein